MTSPFNHTKRALAIIPLMLFLFSCASYNRQITNYYSQMVNSNYESAFTAIDHIKKLKKERNRLLYLLEKGKMAHLLQQYDSSNTYFNEADLFMEDARTSARDIALGTLLNPMMETYKGEDFEKFMVHYYKAMNYLYQGQREEALVEARRIGLRSYSQQDKTNNKDNRYSDDAFSLMMQGIIYEQSGEINNAFISYRNAADLFLKNKNSYYDVPMPAQLQQDVLRTAELNGFTDEFQRYKKLFNVTYQKKEKTSGGELVLFWENGLAPVKVEQNFFFALNKDGAGNFFFTDPSGGFNIPFDFSSSISRDALAAADIRSLRVAFPRYEEQPVFYRDAVITLNNQQYSFEDAQNINSLAVATLKERFIKDMSKTLTRLAVKKIAEAAARPARDEKDQKKKNEQEAMAMAIQVFNFVSEKADTRNWQSLPHSIHYVRLPLQKGSNIITLNLKANGVQDKQVLIHVEGEGGLQVKNVCTLR